ncbi:MAG: TerC family protein [Burkholderiales bacterium]
MEVTLSEAYWIGVVKIIGVNTALSVDNAVVIALAARALPPRQQSTAIFFGSAAAITARVLLTIFAVRLLDYPWLKLIGALVLLWIGIKLLIPEYGSENIDASDNMLAAIKTILIADMVMSLDNVIVVAAASGGSIAVLILGLAVSIPLVMLGATMLLKLMQRWPVIIAVGAALIGWIAGEMIVTERVIEVWIDANAIWLKTVYVVHIVGALVVVAIGTALNKRKEPVVEESS